jgi:hypothetical protein
MSVEQDVAAARRAVDALEHAVYGDGLGGSGRSAS